MLFYLFSVVNQDSGKKMLGLQHFFENEIRDSKFPAAQTSNEPVHEISNNVVHATSKASDQPAHRRSLIRAFASRLSIL